MNLRRNRQSWMLAAIVTAVGLTQLRATNLVAQSTPADEKKPAEKMTEEKKPEAVGPLQPGVRPQPAQRTGLQIPEPTVKLKPGEVPAIKFDTPEYDFGRVQAGGDVIHDFFFTNTGTGPLEILRVKPSCGCTTAGEHTRIVQPGETGKIPIKLSTKSGGNMNKTITVNTNVPGKDATVRLVIKGSAWKPVEVTPQSAAFGRITADKSNAQQERKLTIVSNVDATLNPSLVGSDSALFKAELKTLEEGKKYELVVGLVPPLSAGNNTGRITIKTGIPEPATLEIPAYAFVTAPVDVTPSQLTIMPGRTGELKRQFYVRANDGTAFDIKDLKSTSDKLALEITDVRGNRETYRLSVDIPADYTPPATGDTITFNLTHPDVPSLSIPVVSRPEIGQRPVARGQRAGVNVADVQRAQAVQKAPVSTSESSKDAAKADAAGASKPSDMKPVDQ